MLVLHLECGRVINLERSVSTVNGYGIWEYHRSQSSACGCPTTPPTAPLRQTAGPGHWPEVIVAKPGGPEEEWKPCRSGIADFDEI